MAHHNRDRRASPERRERGLPTRPDDDALADRTERERVDAGLADYDPGDLPPASDEPGKTRVTESEQYREEKTEIDRETKSGEMDSDGTKARRDRAPYPPTRYEDR
ncbi:DEAD/DEAH box helicase [Streptomyces polygonati]|uniref:DEAD/DEAH box helicase n=1 Tax=Streptomyces polygonati TaxID=1617087 RepID=A0ABV8HDY5_9ACTN